ncbi:MAG: aldo/keto reductase [Treponema sp.]|nr:aldo/keto reductase [Treponema sp.]
MEYTTLNNGLLMPVIGFGTVGLNDDAGEKIIIEAIQSGYEMIDTAKMYGNEKIVGKAIKQCGIAREKLFITTKLNEPYNSYELAKNGIEQSLEDLQLDYIDLFLIHEPYTNALEMYKALCEAFEKGIIKAIGISNFNIRRYKEFIKECQIIPAVNQIESNVFYPQLELVKLMKENGTLAEAWSPFASGKKSINDNIILCEISSKYDKTPNQIALRYLIQNGIMAIPKSTNLQRIKQNLDIFDFELSQIDMDIIKTLDGKKSFASWMKDWE